MLLLGDRRAVEGVADVGVGDRLALDADLLAGDRDGTVTCSVTTYLRSRARPASRASRCRRAAAPRSGSSRRRSSGPRCRDRRCRGSVSVSRSRRPGRRVRSRSRRCRVVVPCRRAGGAAWCRCARRAGAQAVVAVELLLLVGGEVAVGVDLRGVLDLGLVEGTRSSSPETWRRQRDEGLLGAEQARVDGDPLRARRSGRRGRPGRSCPACHRRCPRRSNRRWSAGAQCQSCVLQCRWARGRSPRARLSAPGRSRVRARSVARCPSSRGRPEIGPPGTEPSGPVAQQGPDVPSWPGCGLPRKPKKKTLHSRISVPGLSAGGARVGVPGTCHATHLRPELRLGGATRVGGAALPPRQRAEGGYPVRDSRCRLRASRWCRSPPDMRVRGDRGRGRRSRAWARR